MNYSNMIEEKGLKKGFIIATLASTIIGTFTTSLNFYDRVQEKKKSMKQANLDNSQDEQIKQLKDVVDKLQAGKKGGSDTKSQTKKSGSTPTSSRSSSRRRRRRRSIDYDDDYDSDDFRRSAQRSRALIEREFNDNLSALGQRYAQGDVVTENKLQAQIIILQQTVINVLQDAIMDERSLSRADVHRLILAQDQARQGSLEALRGQYERLLPQAYAQPASKQLRIEDAPPALQKQLTLPALPAALEVDQYMPPPKRTQSLPIQPPPGDGVLYCRYSLDLQASRNTPLGLVLALLGVVDVPSVLCASPSPTKTSGLLRFAALRPKGVVVRKCDESTRWMPAW